MPGQFLGNGYSQFDSIVSSDKSGNISQRIEDENTEVKMRTFDGRTLDPEQNQGNSNNKVYISFNDMK